MRIDAVSLVVADVDLSADFYEHVLELPVSRDAGRARITVGASILDIQGDPAHTAPHHLAITIPSNKFDVAKEWIRERVGLLALDGADEFETAPLWNAHSLYFMSPDGTILEFIVRRDLSNHAPGPFTSADLLCVSEVGIAVDDVAAGLRDLAALGVDAYGWNAPDFVPVGDVEGLLILVTPGRPWFPTAIVAQASSISVTGRSGVAGEVTLAPSSRMVLSAQ